MKSKRSQTVSATRRRATRSRPTPRWLLTSTELDQIAQRRCLALLSVLSGETSVSEAILQMQVSRGTYYTLESKALAGMLSALVPGAESNEGQNGLPLSQLKALEEKVKKLEVGKRRAERLLLLTRRVVKPGPVKTGHGRPPGTHNGVRKSRGKTKASPSSTTIPPLDSSGPSTPTKGGESMPRSGSAS
jgi:hypothetical protein